jgi:hypothetical protein
LNQISSTKVKGEERETKKKEQNPFIDDIKT